MKNWADLKYGSEKTYKKRAVEIGKIEEKKSSLEKWCRRRWVLLKNKNGDYGMIDTFEKRYQLMREKISEWAEIMDMAKKEFQGSRLIMITLTIKKVSDYSPGMMRDYMKKLKQMLGKNLWGFAWVAELQERGAVHYHLMVFVPKFQRVPMPDKSGMWHYGMSKIEKAKTAFYLCVYIGKERQKDLSRFPKSCRTYAVSYRLPEGHSKRYVDSLKEVEKHRKIMNDLKKGKNKDWEYVGASVTKGYAEEVMQPSKEKDLL